MSSGQEFKTGLLALLLKRAGEESHMYPPAVEIGTLISSSQQMFFAIITWTLSGGMGLSCVLNVPVQGMAFPCLLLPDPFYVSSSDARDVGPIMPGNDPLHLRFYQFRKHQEITESVIFAAVLETGFEILSRCMLIQCGRRSAKFVS